MREFPTPWVVGLHRYTAGAVNAHNEPTRTWVPAKHVPGIQIKVIGWGPRSVEPVEGHSVDKLELYIPPVLFDLAGDRVADPGPLDLIDLPTGQYEVQGLPRDYTHGFHGWPAGKIVEIQKAAG